MKIEAISSQRKFAHQPFWDIVYEWEDDLSAKLHLPLCYSYVQLPGLWGKLVRRSGLLVELLHSRKMMLEFVMGHYSYDQAARRPNVVPCIIDYLLRSKIDLQNFYRDYGRNPVVLISSREAYSFLMENDCPLNIAHWALSLSDRYLIEPATKFKKEYDCMIVGRANQILKNWMLRYADVHPGFSFVCKGKDGRYVSSRDEDLDDCFKTRDGYMQMLRKAKVGLYSTPSIDAGRLDMNDFNQVTPRFLEYVACGCRVIARYPDNPDTRYYELPDLAPHVEAYEQFAAYMDQALEEPADMRKYAQYLQKHYTSIRAKELVRILEVS